MSTMAERSLASYEEAGEGTQPASQCRARTGPYKRGRPGGCDQGDPVSPRNRQKDPPPRPGGLVLPVRPVAKEPCHVPRLA